MPLDTPRAVPDATSRATLLTLSALWLTVFAASSQVIIVSPLLPDIARALVVPQERLGLIVTSYAVMLGLFAFVAGPVSDRVGRRRILLWGSAAMGVTLGLHAFATSYASLVGVRALAGAAGGLLSGAAVAYVGDAFPYERRGWANGIVMSGIAAGQVLGVPVGKWLALHYDFVVPFLAFGVVSLVAWALIAAFVPQPDVERAERLSVGGALALYADLLRRDAPRSAAIAYLLMFAGVGLFVPYFPLWLEQVVGVPGQQIVVLFLVGGLVNVVAGPWAGRLSDRVGRRPLIFASCVLFALLMAAVPYAVRGLVSATAFFSASMLSVAMRIAPLQSLVSALVPAQERGMMMSGAVALGQIGMASGAGVAGMLYGRFGMQGNTLAGAVALLAMAYVVGVHLPEPTADVPEPA